MTRLSFDLRTATGESVEIDLPLEIRQANMKLVTRTLCSHSVDLAPGTYFISTRLPDGEEHLRPVQITGDEARQSFVITLDSPPEAQRAQPSERPTGGKGSGDRSLRARPAESPTGGKRTGDRSFGVRGRVKDRDSRAESRAVAAALSTDPEEKPAVEPRILSGNLLSGDYEALEHPPFDREGPWLVIHGWDAPLYAQLPASRRSRTQDGDGAWSIALPTGPDDSCRLSWREDGKEDSSIPEIQPHNPQAALLLAYWRKDEARQIEALLASPTLDGESLLGGDPPDPVAAAATAYAHLRFGALERLGSWTETLARDFPWLPDGLAVHGEHLARRGHHREALDHFLALPERGLPLFSDGVSYASSRLRLYLSHGEKSFPDSDLRRAQQVEEKLRAFLAIMVFDQPLTTLTGPILIT